MLLLFALLLVLVAVGGGIGIHPLLFILLVFALVLAITDRRSGAAL